MCDCATIGMIAACAGMVGTILADCSHDGPMEPEREKVSYLTFWGSWGLGLLVSIVWLITEISAIIF